MEGGLRAFLRDTFDPWAQLSVKFVGEDGIDDGGLSVEFLRLFLEELMKSSQLFTGDREKVLVLNELCKNFPTIFQLQFHILCPVHILYVL
jgi:hypothetical protein